MALEIDNKSDLESYCLMKYGNKGSPFTGFQGVHICPTELLFGSNIYR